jgi:hypothetical protein
MRGKAGAARESHRHSWQPARLRLGKGILTLSSPDANMEGKYCSLATAPYQSVRNARRWRWLRKVAGYRLEEEDGS